MLWGVCPSVIRPAAFDIVTGLRSRILTRHHRQGIGPCPWRAGSCAGTAPGVSRRRVLGAGVAISRSSTVSAGYAGADLLARATCSTVPGASNYATELWSRRRVTPGSAGVRGIDPDLEGAHRPAGARCA